MTYTAYIEDTRVPGGSPSAIKKDHNLNTVIYTDGTLSVWGEKEDIESFIEEYSINAEIIQNFIYPRFKWSYGNKYHTISDSLYKKDIASVENFDEVSDLLENLNNGTLEYDSVGEEQVMIPVKVFSGLFGWVIIPNEMVAEYESDENKYVDAEKNKKGKLHKEIEKEIREKYGKYLIKGSMNDDFQLYIKST
jgi:signal recognition particle subunit SEC65